MNKIQYIELLKIRGIEKLDKGQSIADALNKSGGAPTTEEEARMNAAAMKYYINKFTEARDENQNLKIRIKDLTSRIRDKEDWIECLESAGLNDWAGIENAHTLYHNRNDLAY